MFPKYRAWLKSKKRMIDVYSINFEEKTVQWIENTIYIRTEGFEDVILMQTTHIKNKRENELFDGDIVMLKWTVYDEPSPYVIWQSRTGEWRVDNRYSGKVLGFSNDDCELVGNVFENAEEYPEMKKEWLDRQEQRRQWLK